MTDISDWAHKYAQRGWATLELHGVVDGECSCGKGCQSPGKRPWERNWTQVPVRDPSTYRPHSNIGIRTGRESGIIVLDVDKHKGGGDSLKHLLTKYGDLPEGPRQRTGVGGWHFVFQYEEHLSDILNCSSFLQGLDIRTTGGQIVAAPSVHASGNPYVWEGYDLPVPKMPLWLANVARLRENVPNNVSEILTKMDRDGSHDGSSALIKVAARACKLGVRTESDFLEAVKEWNGGRWEDEELLVRFRDALGRHLNEGTVTLPLNNKGVPILSVNALKTILTTDPRYAGRLVWDQMALTYRIDGRLWSDRDGEDIKLDLCARYGWAAIPDNLLGTGLVGATREMEINPLLDYLDELEWDGVSRVDGLLERVFKSARDEYFDLRQSMLTRWLISAVARAYRPGCKADGVLLLTGPQGVGKSTFFDVLGGKWFTDSHIDIKSKDAYLLLRSAWIVEMSELSAWSGRTAEEIKAFVSSREDYFRLPYGKTTTAFPRHCVFGATTNDSEVLRDATGNRRYWILEVGESMDIDYLKEHRDQIWAEVVNLFLKDKPWFLTFAEQALLREYQATYEPEREALEGASEWLRGRVGGTFTWTDLLDGIGYTGKPSRDERLYLQNLLDRGAWKKVKISGKRLYKQEVK